MCVSCFFLHRLAEKFKPSKNFEPKLFPDGTSYGCLTIFFTETMRLRAYHKKTSS